MRNRTVSKEPSEPVVDLRIPMTKLQLEPAEPPPAVDPAPAAVPVEAPPPSAIPLLRAHRGASAVIIVGIGSGMGLLIGLVGAIVGLLVGSGLYGGLLGVLLGLGAGAAAWALARDDLNKMDRGLMDSAGRVWALHGRLAGQIACAAWGFLLYTLLVFQTGFLLGKAGGMAP
jgi:hypothetical protein